VCGVVVVRSGATKLIKLIYPAAAQESNKATGREKDRGIERERIAHKSAFVL